MINTFKVIEKSWYKRRAPDATSIVPVDVDIPEYRSEHNHMCHMKVTYSDGSTKRLLSRVIYNTLNDTWTVDGMEVAVRVVEESEQEHLK